MSRRTGGLARIELPTEPLTDRPTALRPWHDADVAALAVAANDDEIARWTRVPVNYSEADARMYLFMRDDGIAAGEHAPFAIVSSEDGRLLGSVALIRFAWKHARAEVGYWLARGERGSGHATRAVQLICRWGFESLGLERIDLHAATGNEPSLRVAERCGFTREAVLRSYLVGKDGRNDMVAFGLLRDEAGSGAESGG